MLFISLVLGCNPAPPADDAATEPAAASNAVVLISLDGFRWDYQQLTDTPHLDALASRGVQAAGLIPVFPSKTFPSHYSIVTGLYPGHHGIVSNNMRDPRWDGDFRLGTEELTRGRWWGGEPIWTTARKNGLRAASYFWPGSDVLIDGDRPDYFYAYDGAVPYEERVDQVLAWLRLPADERPQFITLYFADPNDTAHRVGPEAPEALAAVRRVDAMVGRLVRGLEEHGLAAATDLVVTSDHGMAQMSPERVVFLDDYIELTRQEVFESGSFLQIYPQAGREAEILEALRVAHPHLEVHARDALPDRYRLRGNTRLAPIIGVPDIGWSVAGRAPAEGDWDGFLLGNHGGDPYHPDMAGIFIAAGPSFAVGRRVPAFENIEVYNLLARALNIAPAPNDGDPSRVEEFLREP